MTSSETVVTVVRPRPRPRGGDDDKGNDDKVDREKGQEEEVEYGGDVEENKEKTT